MAFTSVEAIIYAWAEREGLYPEHLGRGSIQQLAEEISEHMHPFTQLAHSALTLAPVDADDVKKAKETLGLFQNKVHKNQQPMYMHTLLVTVLSDTPASEDLESLGGAIASGDVVGTSRVLDVQQLTRSQAKEMRARIEE